MCDIQLENYLPEDCGCPFGSDLWLLHRKGNCQKRGLRLREWICCVLCCLRFGHQFSGRRKSPPPETSMVYIFSKVVRFRSN